MLQTWGVLQLTQVEDRQLARCEVEWRLYFSSCKEKGGISQNWSHLFKKKKCNSGAASRKITFCQKNSSVENVLQPPLTSRLHRSPTGLLWGLHGVHSRTVRTPQLSSACRCSDHHYNSAILKGRFSVSSCFLSSPNSTVGADEICW